MSLRSVSVAAAVALGLALGARGAAPPGETFAASGKAATATLLQVFYGGNGMWRACDAADCPQGNQDWGVDSLTYALWLRWETAHDSSIAPVMQQLLATAPAYPPPCTASCGSWSDVPEWDAIAAMREYAVLGDPAALSKAKAAFASVEGSNAYRLGACPEIRYQQPYGRDNHLKTLETDANAVKAALLLYRATGDRSYLADATTTYAAVRKWFFDRSAGLYSVYVFDDGRRCTQLPHRFFASVNGDMIWSGVALAAATGNAEYRRQALASGRAVAGSLADPAGVFADMQAENDIVEPLVEAMYSLATGLHATFARSWIVTNAAAAVGARASDGAFGRFFDGPPPSTQITAWQSNGGLALEIAAAALDPAGRAAEPTAWARAVQLPTDAGPGESITIDGSAVAFLGTLGETCCEAGHARVFVDGRQTFDRTGIWQNKSSLGRSIPSTILFAWRWPRAGRHTIRFEPGIANGKEGGSFLHLSSYLVG